VKSVLAEVKGSVAFGWSPDGQRVAYLINDPEAADSSSRTMTVLDPDRPGEAKSLQEELIVAFFWSPDSKKIAYFVPSLVTSTQELDQNGQPTTTILLSLNIYDVRNGKSMQVAVFRPTEQFINLLPFFDQYQHSVSLWSPDSRHLVLSAVDGQENNGIFIVEAAANLQPRLLAPGEIALWSWK
jgi:Tol biopolymer transport system component